MRGGVKQVGRLILIDPEEVARELLGERLRMQGYSVTVAASAAEGAHMALSSPPAAVIADLWMPSVSGVELCRLLKAEAATEHVPVLLRGPDDRRNQFWAERAGANGYVVKGRMGDLVRALDRAIAATPPSDGFFMELSGHGTEIHDRIAAHLGRALFDSVIASEVRALSVCGEFTRLFDLLTQFLCQVLDYRWVAMTAVAPANAPARFALHAHPARREEAQVEARAALGMPDDVALTLVEDQDAHDAPAGPAPVVREVKFANSPLGRLALAPRGPLSAQDDALVSVIVRELGGPVRMAALVEEAQRLATVDPLTNLSNRRAFTAALDMELERSRRLRYPLSVLMLDVDHFKHINDLHGHARGDAVLSAVGKLMAGHLRRVDLVARWGGEEFVAVLTGTDDAGALVVGERLRAALEALDVRGADGARLRVTGSFGLASWDRSEGQDALINRADKAMYLAKADGRNRVRVAAVPGVQAAVVALD
jgi:two-component system, cell cycle response regulator